MMWVGRAHPQSGVQQGHLPTHHLLVQISNQHIPPPSLISQGLFQHANSFLTVAVFFSHQLQLPHIPHLSLSRHPRASPALLLQGGIRGWMESEVEGGWEFQVEDAFDCESGMMGVVGVVVVAFGVDDTALEQGELCSGPIPTMLKQSLLRASILPLQISPNFLPSNPLQTQILLKSRPMPHHHSQQVHQLTQTHLPPLTSHSLLPLSLTLHCHLALLLLGSRFLRGLENSRRRDYTITIVQFLTEYSNSLVVMIGQGVGGGGFADEAVLVGLDLRHVYIIDSSPPIIGSTFRNPHQPPPCALQA